MKEGALIPKEMKRWADSFLACRSVLVRVVGRFVRPHEIEDLVQETFVRSYTASRRHAIQNPGAFMVRTARNLALNSVSRAENRHNVSIENYLETDSLVESQTPESESQTRERFLTFCHAVAELPIRCRRVFILKKVYGLKQKEIAEHLGISQSTVKKHVTKGMVMITEYMLDNGYDLGGLEESRTHRPKDRVKKS